jgi:rfaE bifunctional protein nucleotidyltransferase chain/domain
VAFTNGCFDILHRGHVDYLFKTAGLADRLVVGLNSDASVARLKGAHRPLQDQQSRADVLAGLGCIDGLCVFEEDMPLVLIKKLRPDLLVKGNDYGIDQIVGAREVMAYGGHVVALPLLPGYSTTAIERRARTAWGSEQITTDRGTLR